MSSCGTLVKGLMRSSLRRSDSMLPRLSTVRLPQKRLGARLPKAGTPAGAPAGAAVIVTLCRAGHGADLLLGADLLVLLPTLLVVLGVALLVGLLRVVPRRREDAPRVPGVVMPGPRVPRESSEAPQVSDMV